MIRTVSRLIARLLARWHLRAARRTVARFLDGRFSLDEAATRLWPAMRRYGFYDHLGAPPLPTGIAGSFEAFSLAPDGSFGVEARLETLVERSWELGLGTEQYNRIRQLRQAHERPESNECAV